METTPLVFEQTYQASIETIWEAITDKDQMKEWYFDLSEFKPETGFEFAFTGGSPEKKYVHHCKILEAIAPARLSYSWQYEGYPGYSVVTFDLFKEAEKITRVQLTHSGVDSFPQGSPDFARASFTQGWTFILGESLRKFLEKGTAGR